MQRTWPLWANTISPRIKCVSGKYWTLCLFSLCKSLSCLYESCRILLWTHARSVGGARALGFQRPFLFMFGPVPSNTTYLCAKWIRIVFYLKRTFLWSTRFWQSHQEEVDDQHRQTYMRTGASFDGFHCSIMSSDLCLRIRYHFWHFRESYQGQCSKFSILILLVKP